MLPFTEIPKRKLSYSLPAENNIPGVVPYICIDFDKASNMEIDEFERAVKNTTWDGFSIYKLNLATPPVKMKWRNTILGKQTLQKDR